MKLNSNGSPIVPRFHEFTRMNADFEQKSLLCSNETMVWNSTAVLLDLKFE